jgi:hypothetical protein
MIILSFDIGIKNLAYCLTGHDGNITHWDVVTLAPNAANASIQTCCVGLVRELGKIEDLIVTNDRVVVLIEQQTATNVRMKVLSHCIQVFFEKPPRRHDYVVRFCATAVKGLGSWGSGDRAAIKKEAVRKAAELLVGAPEWAKVLAQARKKDDLADCYLQSVGFRASEGVTI